MTTDDKPRRTPCSDRWDVYESLHGRYGANPEAIEAARNMCGTCLLTQPDVARACLAANKGERWRAHVLAKPVVARKPETPAWQAFGAERLATLRQLVTLNYSTEMAAKHLGINRNALWTWCKNHGHLDLYHALGADERYGNQHRKTDLGTISLRRKKKRAA